VCAESSWLDVWLKAQKAPIILTASEEGDEQEDDQTQSAVESSVSVLEQNPSQVTIYHYTPAPQGISGYWQPQEPELVMQLLALGAAESKINLLSGRYKPQAAWRKHLKPWRKVVIAAGLVFAALIGENIISTQQLEQQAKEYHTESKRIFREVLPQFKRIPSQSYMKNQMNAAIKSLGGSGADNGILMWLSELKPALAKAPSVKVVNLKYDRKRGELRLQATSSDFQGFEQLRSILSQSFNVEQGQLNKQDGLVSGAVVLRRKA
jgi:general secretion pathway protein L